MADFYAGNRFLTRAEMLTNGRYICDYLTARGWTINAVCGMLGNMQTESTCNPAIWQNLDAGNTSLGFGLCQWTPATKYLNWCSDRGLDPEHMDSALQRIEYELDNGLQYYPTNSYPLTFAQFKVSTQSPYYLGQAFLRNYERPANQSTTTRGSQALEWFEYLNGVAWEGASSNKVTVKKKNSMSLLLLTLASRKR